jgi:hypothetical protein
MSQNSDHSLLKSQRSLKHEFCIVCVLCACHDPIEATVPQPCNFTPVPPARLSSLGYFAPGLGPDSELGFTSVHHLSHGPSSFEEFLKSERLAGRWMSLWSDFLERTLGHCSSCPKANLRTEPT